MARERAPAHSGERLMMLSVAVKTEDSRCGDSDSDSDGSGDHDEASSAFRIKSAAAFVTGAWSEMSDSQPKAERLGKKK